jgi:hypothetical protein
VAGVLLRNTQEVFLNLKCFIAIKTLSNPENSYIGYWRKLPSEKTGAKTVLKKLSALMIIPLMILGAILVPTVGHAQMTGLVSINGGTEVVAAPGQTTVQVPVTISGSDSFNAYAIQIVASNSYLSGASISLGTVLPNPSVLSECINGVLIAGTSCPIQSQTGVVALAVANQAGQSAAAGASGALFTITYTITGSTTGTPLVFNTGCIGQSTGNSDCVLVALGSNVNSETDQSTTFANVVDFTMTPQFASLSTPSGVQINDVINYGTEGGYADYVSEACSATSGLSCSFATGSVDLYDYTSGSDTLMVTGTTSGSVTVNATGEGFCSPYPACVRSHVVTIPVLIAPAGFSFTLSQSMVTISPGGSDSTTSISLQGVSGFSGTVSFTSSAVSGIAGTAPMATLTADGSGYSTATSTLTVTVASSVAAGTYPLTVKGTSGTATYSQSINVVVPVADFNVVANPNAIEITRGGSVASIITLNSFGAFSGTATLTATVAPVAGQQDSCCLTNNITPAFSSSSVALPADGSVTVAFSASSIGGSAPASSYTATGNYTATINATIAGVSRITVINFSVYDFTVGPAFCTGSNLTVSAEGDFGAVDSPQFLNSTFAGIYVGGACNSLTITDQPNILPPFGGGALFGDDSNAQILWVQANAYGGINTGLQTNGWNGTPAIAALNTQIPAQGLPIPQLAVDFPANGSIIGGKGPFYFSSYACLLPTFWANGTQIPYSYLATHGPLLIPGTGVWAFLYGLEPGSVAPGSLGNWGCGYDAGAFPNDAGTPLFNAAVGTNIPRTENPDYWAVTAMAINGTLAGNYSFQFCGQAGVLRHCTTYGLTVVKAPVIYATAAKNVSFKHSHGKIQFFAFFYNPDTTHTEYVQATLSGVGTLGDTITVTTAVIKLTAGFFSINFAFPTAAITSSMVGETFTFTFSMNVGTDPTNLNGVSTQHFGPSQFTVTITK